MKDPLFWLLVGVAALLLGIGFLAIAVRHFGGRVAGLVEPPLFKRIADAHGLTPAQRSLLLRLALRHRLPDPATYFISPSGLSRALLHLRAENPQAARGAQDLMTRLFGTLGEPPRA